MRATPGSIPNLSLNAVMEIISRRRPSCGGRPGLWSVCRVVKFFQGLIKRFIFLTALFTDLEMILHGTKGGGDICVRQMEIGKITRVVQEFIAVYLDFPCARESGQECAQLF